MDPKALSILVAAFANFALATYVLLKNPKKITNISFSLFVFSAVVWSLAIFIIEIGREREMLEFAGHLTFFGGAMMACNLCLFSYVFPQTSANTVSKKVLLWIYVPGGLAAIAAFTPFVLEDITYVGERVRPVYGNGILLFTGYAIIFTAYSLFQLARKYLAHPGRFERVQLKYTFWGLLIPITAVVFITLVLPQVGISRLSDLTPLLTVVSAASISYAIVRFRLMDLGVVFRNVLIYTGITILMTAALIGVIVVVNPILKLPPRSAVFLAAACAALLVQPLRSQMETLVDRYFFRGRYNYQAALTEFSSSMTWILDLDDLQNRIVHEVASILQVRTTALLLWENDENKFTTRSSIPLALGGADGAIPGDADVVKRMNKERSLLVREELKRSLPLSEFEPIEKDFARMEAEVFIPLIYRGELIGILSLGEKISSDIYSSEDLNLLATLGNQAAVALENALLHHTVTLLKNHNDNILKYMSSGVVAVDRKQVITTCNDKAREILRLLPQGAINQNIDALPLPLRSMLVHTLEGKSRYSNHEVQVLSQENSISHLSASTSLIKGEKDEVTGALLVFNDLTDIKLLEGEMWRADKLASLGTLAAGMAHEIKNPLVSIKTFAQLLPSRYGDAEFREKFSSITVDEVERINTIVEKLLEFARPTAPAFESVDIIEIIEEVLLLLSSETTKMGVAVEKVFDIPSAPIIGDKSQLKQVLLNLCLNGLQAIQATDNGFGGELNISVSLRKSKHPHLGDIADPIARMFYGTEAATSMEEADAVLIKVRDTGKGISRKDLARIFDPFFTTKEKGLGLGLAVVHGIIKEHSGTISVDSKENAGTEFVISLPVNQIFAKEKV